MKLILSKILFLFGDLISKLLNYDCFAWLYPLYSRIMGLSCDLDKNGRIWKIIKKRKLHN
ncbi:MAG: hypothetical protein EBY39_07115 [Flavobacteriia bacterium]|nr:hypothetical protein [Flavobacteriia bacterium]